MDGFFFSPGERREEGGRREDIKIGRLMRTGEKEDNGALSKSCRLENFVQIGW